MKVEFLETEGTLTVAALRDTLSLVLALDELPSIDQLNQLTPLEQQMAYDWAMREHLHASGNRIQRRAKPFGVRVGALSSLTYEEDVKVIGDQARTMARMSSELESRGDRVAELEARIEELSALVDNQPQESRSAH